MNKYSSKAVKTAATVGMSLAMVLSNAAPVFAATPAAVCTKTGDEACGRTVYNAILDKLGDTTFADSNMDDALKITAADGKTKVTIYEAIEANAADLATFRTSLSYGDAYKNVTKMLDFNSAMTAAFGAGYSSLADVTSTTVGGYVATYLATDYTTTKTDAKSKLSDLKDDKKAMTGIMGGDFEVLLNRAQTVLEDILEISSDDYDADLADFYDAFSKVLENDLDGKNTILNADEHSITGLGTVTDETKDKDDKDKKYEVTKVTLSSKSAVKGRINAIKDATDYDQFKDEDLVISLIDTYQDVIDNIGNITDIASTDAYKAYNKTKTDDEDKTVKAFLVDFFKGETNLKYGKVDANGKYVAGTNASTAKEEAKAVAKVLDNEQWAILKDLKEEVLDSVWSFETSKVGNYYRDKSDFNSYVSAAQKSIIMDNVPGFLLKVVDTETGEFGYDYVEAHMDAFNEALDAVTTGIAKITPANIKTTDKAALEAAEDAIYELYYNKGKYVNNLTDKELKTVRQADTKITNLREAFDNLGTTAVAGWYDMGNGNWGYNNEDGTPAAYKWVASGSDWYMIKDGKMLRNTWLATDGGRWYYLDNAGKMVTNQSVDGCWINSYGVYMSPSYNG